MAAMTSKYNFECVIQYYTDQCNKPIEITVWLASAYDFYARVVKVC